MKTPSPGFTYGRLPHPWKRPKTGTRGFSILEVLVAASVFLVLLLALLAITTGTTNLTSLARRNMDASSKLRASMDRLTTDAQNAVIDPEAPFYIISDGSNQELHFLSRVDGYDGQRPLAVVRYRIRPRDNDNGSAERVFVLERAAEGVDMTHPSHKNADPSGASDEFDVLAEGVFRFSVDFIGTDGQPVMPDGSGVLQTSRLGAMLVSLAAIDDRASAVAPDTDWRTALPGQGFTQWEEQLRTLNFPDLTPEAARGIQIRRKLIPLHGSGS